MPAELLPQRAAHQPVGQAGQDPVDGIAAPLHPDANAGGQRRAGEAPQRGRERRHLLLHGGAEAVVHERDREGVGRTEGERPLDVLAPLDEEEGVSLGERQHELIVPGHVRERQEVDPEVVRPGAHRRVAAVDGVDDGALREADALGSPGGPAREEEQEGILRPHRVHERVPGRVVQRGGAVADHLLDGSCRTPGGSAPAGSGASVTTATRPAAASSAPAVESLAHCAGPETKATRGRTRSAMASAGSSARLEKSAAGSARSACAPSATSCQAGEFSASMSSRSPGPSPAAASVAAARRTARSKAAKVTTVGAASRARGSRTRRNVASGVRRAVARSRAGKRAVLEPLQLERLHGHGCGVGPRGEHDRSLSRARHGRLAWRPIGG